MKICKLECGCEIRECGRYSQTVKYCKQHLEEKIRQCFSFLKLKMSELENE